MMQLDRSIMIAYFERIKQNWLSTKASFPETLPIVTLSKKIANELYIDRMMKDVQAKRKQFTKAKKKYWMQQMQQMMHRAIQEENIIGIRNCMPEAKIDAMQAELMEFLRQVRTFAPEISLEDIGQAIRNYIVFIMFKEIHQAPAGFSNAAFGYSMLYPFTDNYIDGTVSVQEKQQYNIMIRNQIKQNPIKTTTLHEKKTCQLLDMIEAEFPVADDTSMEMLLEMMLDAQVDSLKQQSSEYALSYEDRLDISICKGGLSVFIDRLLIKHPIAAEDLDFYLGFGLYLQLADDLQDIEEDYTNGSQTIFTCNLQQEAVEKTINQLLQFVTNLVNHFSFTSKELQEFVLYASQQLIFTSVVRSRKYVSEAFLCKIEQYLPVTMQYYEESRSHMQNQQSQKNEKRIFQMLDELIIME